MSTRETMRQILVEAVLTEREWSMLIGDPNVDVMELDELIELLYEIEYKHSMLSDKPFLGLRQRKGNMLLHLEKVGYTAARAFAEYLIPVFDDWLSKHAITNAEQWAKARLDALDEDGYSDESMWEVIDGEFKRYAGMEIRPNDFDLDLMPRLGTQIELMRQADADSWDEEKEAGDPEPDEENPYLDMNTDEFFEAAIDAWGSFDEFMKQAVLPSPHIGVPDILEEIYAKVVFPEWFNHWQAEGIVETRERIEDAQKELIEYNINAENYALGKLLSRLNYILNVSHQTGSMMDYISEAYPEIDWEFLQNMSDRTTTDWDQELAELGVEMGVAA